MTLPLMKETAKRNITGNGKRNLKGLTPSVQAMERAIKQAAEGITGEKHHTKNKKIDKNVFYTPTL